MNVSLWLRLLKNSDLEGFSMSAFSRSGHFGSARSIRPGGCGLSGWLMECFGALIRQKLVLGAVCWRILLAV